METIIFTIKLAFSLMVGAIISALGGADMLLQVLIGFMAVDYITGVIFAIKIKNLSSEIGFNGFYKKMCILLFVCIAQMLDNLTGQPITRSITILFYISNEGISILENAAKLNIPYPNKIKELLAQIKQDNKDGDT
jgi:toxin secretion/phage lysis holin